MSSVGGKAGLLAAIQRCVSEHSEKIIVRSIVIGAGLGGLAAAIRLAGQGHSVTLLEQREQLGGRAGRLTVDGYTFDTGPTIVTAPSLLEDVWSSAGGRLADDVTLIKLNPFYRIYFADGRSFDYGDSADVMDQSLRYFDLEGPEQFRRFMAATAPIYARGFADLASRPFHSLRTFVGVVPDLARLGALRSVYHFASRFFRDESLRTVFSFHPLFIGGNPFVASAIYAMVPYLEQREGVSFVAGGMFELVKAMARLFERRGGTVRLGAEVAQILVANGRASGVVLTTGEALAADTIVANSDVSHTYQKLLPVATRGTFRPLRLKRYRHSMSCFLLYLGLKRQYPKLVHHTIVMPEHYESTVKSIFAARGLPAELAMYVHTPTRTDSSFAPPGCESVYVLVPVPNLAASIDWRTEAKPFRDRIVDALEHTFGLEGLADSIVVERQFTPLDFEREYHSYLGAAFGIEPTLLQSAYLRPHNRPGGIDGFYFVGAGTHPGAGLPGVLLSAKISTDLVREDQAARGRDLAKRAGVRT